MKLNICEVPLCFLKDGLVADHGRVVPYATFRQAEKRFPRFARTLRVSACATTFTDQLITIHRNKGVHKCATYILTVPVKYTVNGEEKTKYTRVGTPFENTKKDTGETFLSLKLDFPVAVTELVAFQPKPKGDEKDIEA